MFDVVILRIRHFGNIFGMNCKKEFSLLRISYFSIMSPLTNIINFVISVVHEAHFWDLQIMKSDQNTLSETCSSTLPGYGKQSG